ncbi:MAG: hypothetical protein D8M58_20135 [Calditrichaeota bacterium]|nr:MAG: hypothetical protein DWQ03_14120 [Calditrichota bacterium]MBL1207720.1 hypothetical protein [Calditrichota bacterium]NOG47555.1 FecR domain-containing protein [Calditrichota bacterium]
MLLKTVTLLTLFTLISCEYTKKKEVTLAGKPSVYFLIGDASINGQPVSLGQEIFNGDLIETGKESFLEVKFGKQSAFRVREESQVTYNFDGSINLNIVKGKVLNILEKNSKYKVRTPTAVAAVRGTIFFVSVIDQDKSYFCACNGTISIEDDKQTELTNLSSAHHHSNFSERTDDKLEMDHAGMMQHDDLEIFDFMYRLDNAVKKPAE